MLKTKNNHVLIMILVTAAVLMVPLVAMRFTEEVQWTALDFAVAAVLLLGTGLTYEFLSRKTNSRKARFAIGISLFIALTVIWGQLAT